MSSTATVWLLVFGVLGGIAISTWLYGRRRKRPAKPSEARHDGKPDGA
jgi:LPXTG-motif cell wall-anchored protein